MADGLNICVVGHSVAAKCHVGNSLLRQPNAFRQFNWTSLQVKSTHHNTIKGERINVLVTPNINSPSWNTVKRKLKSLYKTRIFMYVINTFENFDIDDTLNMKNICNFFGKGTQIMLIVYHAKTCKEKALESCKNLFSIVSQNYACLSSDDPDQKASNNPNKSSSNDPDKNEFSNEALLVVHGMLVKNESKKPMSMRQYQGSRDTADGSVGGRTIGQAASRAPTRLAVSKTEQSTIDSVTVESSSNNGNASASKVVLSNDHYQLYYKTLRAGKSRSCHTRVNVVGHQGVGKTTLIKRLQNLDIRCPSPKLEPTEGLEISRSTSRVMEDKHGKRLWESKPEGFEKEMIYDKMAQAMYNVRKEEAERNESLSKCATLYVDEFGDQIFFGSDEVYDDDGLMEMMDSSVDVKSVQLDANKPEEIDWSTYKRSVEKQQYLRNIVNELESTKGNRRYVTYWDFAGQTAYYTTHQAFMSPSAVYLLVIDLSKPLEESIEDNLRFRKQLTEKSSVLEAIRFWTGSIKAYTASQAVNKDFSHAPVVVVGTHKDRVDKKKVKEVFNKVRFAMKIDSLPCIAIDNTLECATDADLHKIRDKIIDDGIGILDREFKTSWIDLEYSLLQEKNEGKIILTFDELKIIDLNCDMPIREPAGLRSFLEYQHCNGFLMYFPMLEELIILEPTILVTIINELLRRRARDKSANSSHATETSAGWCSDGIFDRNYILDAVKNESKIVYENIDNILDLLTHLKIVYPRNFEESNMIYFMPCLLPDKPDDNLLASAPRCSKSPVVKYIFENQAIPPAFFHSLTASLLSVWPPNKKRQVMEIYNLYACFCIEGDTSLLEMYWTESNIKISIINFSSKRSMLDLKCEVVLETVKQHIYKILQTYRHIHLNCTVLLCCPEHTTSPSYLELDKLVNTEETMCYHDSGAHLVTAEEAFKGWFSNSYSHSLSDREKRILPKSIEEHMLRKLALTLTSDDPNSLACKLQLENPWNTARNVLVGCNGDHQVANFRVLLKWKQEKPEAEWPTLLELLTRIGTYTMAGLEQALLGEIPAGKYDSIKAKLDSKPSEKQCDIISKFIDTKYVFLFLELGFSYSTVMQVSHNGNNPIEATRILLICWVQQNPKSATLRTVLDIASYLRMNTNAMANKL